MACSVYSGIGTATHGAVPLEQVQSITVNEAGEFISARGDDQVYKCGVAVNLVDVTGDINLRDMAVCETIAIGADETLSFTAVQKSPAATAGDNGAIQVVNCVIGTKNNTFNHGSESELTLPWEAYGTDGATSPVTYDYTP